MGKNKKADLLSSSGSFILTVLLILAIRWILFEPYVIPSGSMIPSLLINDHVLVDKSAYGLRVPFTSEWLMHWARPERGQVVVFRSVEDPGYFMIKRVIGLPGDKIEILSDGQLRINDELVAREKLLKEEFLSEGANDYRLEARDVHTRLEGKAFFRETLGKYQYRVMWDKSRSQAAGEQSNEETYIVPQGSLFMMGDNRDNSRDSRYWGALPLENLLGEAQFVWLSCYSMIPNVPFICDPTEIRWSRFFHKIIREH